MLRSTKGNQYIYYQFIYQSPVSEDRYIHKVYRWIDSLMDIYRYIHKVLDDRQSDV